MNKDNLSFDRRQFARFDQQFVVSYSDLGAIEPKFDVTQIKNISIGGILFTTGKEFPKGSVLDIRIRSLTGFEYIRMKVEVVESRQRIKGISYDTRAKFFSLKREEIDSIRKLIKQRLKQG